MSQPRRLWKVRYHLTAPVIGPLPRQGLITHYISLSAAEHTIVIEYTPIPLPRTNLTIRYDSGVARDN